MSISILYKTRTNLLSLIENVSTDTLFKIPENYNNHLFWNFAHCIVTQQILCYKLSGLETSIKTEYIEQYRKGSQPEAIVLNDHLSIFKDLSLKTIHDFEKDYKNEIFNSFTSYETSYGVKLESIEDAISFNNVHEGMHLGYMKAMLNALK